MNATGEQRELSVELKRLADQYPGQAACIVLDGDRYLIGVLSASDLTSEDWTKGPVSIPVQAEDEIEIVGSLSAEAI